MNDDVKVATVNAWNSDRVHVCMDTGQKTTMNLCEKSLGEVRALLLCVAVAVALAAVNIIILQKSAMHLSKVDNFVALAI